MGRPLFLPPARSRLSSAAGRGKSRQRFLGEISPSADGRGRIWISGADSSVPAGITSAWALYSKGRTASGALRAERVQCGGAMRLSGRQLFCQDIPCPKRLFSLPVPRAGAL